MRKLLSLASITAEEWRNFALYFSEIARYELDLMSDEEADAWEDFIRFLELASLHFTTEDQIEAARLSLLTYLFKYRALNGRWKCKPNHHLALHLIQHWRDIGTPLAMSTFWYAELDCQYRLLHSRAAVFFEYGQGRAFFFGSRQIAGSAKKMRF